jgi:hypothetical protein
MKNLPGFASLLATSPEKRKQYMNNGGQGSLAGMLGQRMQPNQQAFQNANQNAQFQQDRQEATYGQALGTPWNMRQAQVGLLAGQHQANDNYLTATQYAPMDRAEYLQETMQRNEDPAEMDWRARRRERLLRRKQRMADRLRNRY